MNTNDTLYTLKKSQRGGGSILSPSYTIYEILYDRCALPIKLLNKEFAEDAVFLLNAASTSGAHDAGVYVNAHNIRDISDTNVNYVENKPYDLVLYKGPDDDLYSYSITYEEDVIRDIKQSKLRTINTLVRLLNHSYDTAFNLEIIKKQNSVESNSPNLY